MLKNSSNRHNLDNSMKKPHIFFILSIVSICLLMGFSPIPEKSPVTFEQEKITIKTASGEYSYNAEIARNEAQQERGLMYRTSLADNNGMLFLFNGNKQVNMWMKNTLIPLDMLFIDKLGKIAYIAKNAKPNSLDIINAGDAPVSAVLELKGGAADEHHINVGDQVIYKDIKQ